jgi:GTPase SAR1 family protein
VILVGNKCDLAPTRCVSREEAEDFARAHDLKYIETSALDGTGVEEAFHRAAQELLRKVETGAIAGTIPAPPKGVRIVEDKGTPSKGCSC